MKTAITVLMVLLLSLAISGHAFADNEELNVSANEDTICSWTLTFTGSGYPANTPIRVYVADYASNVPLFCPGIDTSNVITEFETVSNSNGGFELSVPVSFYGRYLEFYAVTGDYQPGHGGPFAKDEITYGFLEDVTLSIVENHYNGDCTWNVTFSGTGFHPNTTLTLAERHSDVGKHCGDRQPETTLRSVAASFGLGMAVTTDAQGNFSVTANVTGEGGMSDRFEVTSADGFGAFGDIQYSDPPRPASVYSGEQTTSEGFNPLKTKEGLTLGLAGLGLIMAVLQGLFSSKSVSLLDAVITIVGTVVVGWVVLIVLTAALAFLVVALLLGGSCVGVIIVFFR